MRGKKWKRIIALIAALIMTVSSTGISSLAEEDGATAAESDKIISPLQDSKEFFANGIPIRIERISEEEEEEGALIVWDAGENETDGTRWDAGQKEVASDTVVYGGSSEGSQASTEVTMNGGTIAGLFGAGKQDTVINSSVLLTGGNVTGEVFAGGENSTIETATVTVMVSGKYLDNGNPATNEDGDQLPAFYAQKEIYLGNSANTAVTKESDLILKNGGEEANAVFSRNIYANVSYEKEDESGTIIQKGGVAEGAKVKVIFDTYCGSYEGTLPPSEEIDEISAVNGSRVYLNRQLEAELSAKIAEGSNIFFEGEKVETPFMAASAVSEEDEVITAAADESTLIEPAHGETGHVHVGENLYLVDLYSDQRDISYIKAKFYDAEPQLNTVTGLHEAQAGTVTKEIYMTKGEQYYSVAIPQHPATTATNINSDDRPRFNWVCFEIHLSDGTILPHQRAYNIMGSDEEVYDITNHTVSFAFEVGKKDAVFAGLNVENTDSEGGLLTRSYIGVHPDSTEKILMGRNLYLKFGQIENADQYTITWNVNGTDHTAALSGDDLIHTTTNTDTFVYRFTASGQATESTIFTLNDPQGNAVLRFTYSGVDEKNMLLIESLLNNTGAWGVYQANITGDTRTICFNNYSSRLTNVQIGWEDNGGSHWEDMLLTTLDGDPKDVLYYYSDFPADVQTVYFLGTYNNSEYGISCQIDDSYDYPCFYAVRARTADSLTGLTGTWKNVRSIADTGDTVQDIQRGTFTRDSSAYYATASMYDYYSVPELEGWTLKDNPFANGYDYAQQPNYFDMALSWYYQSNGWAENVTDNKYALYWGTTGGLNSIGSSLYAYVSRTTVNGWGATDGQNGNLCLAQGMVDSKLSENGELTQNSVQVPFFNESFIRGDNAYQAAVGNVYKNVKFGFAENSDGYWEFDSSKNTNSAELKYDADNGYYMANRAVSSAVENANYTSYGVNTQYGFFPFESYNDEKPYSSYYRNMNYRNEMFGMHMDIPFTLTSDGKITMEDSNGNSEKRDIVFNFSGDDDVWIFVDGELVLDMAGNHGPTSGSINFATGAVTYGSTSTTYYDVNARQSVSSSNSTFVSGLKNDSGDHTLSIFYLERGLWDSNLKIVFNFPSENKLTVTNTIDTSAADQKIFGEALKHMGSFNYFLYNQAVNGTALAVEDSQGYIAPGAYVVIADGDEAVTKSDLDTNNYITVKEAVSYDGTTSIYYRNTAPDPGSSNWSLDSDAVKERLASISVAGGSTLGENADYLYLKIRSNVASASGTRLYTQITYTDGSTWGGFASQLKYEGYSNTVYANLWSEIRLDLSEADKTKAIQSIDFAWYSQGTELYVDEIRVYEPMNINENTGFATDQSQISDYGSINEGSLQPAAGAFFTKNLSEPSGRASGGSLAYVDDMGVFSLADGQEATFVDKFRFGSYLYLNEAVSDDGGKVFDTTYSIREKGDDGEYSDIGANLLMPGRSDTLTTVNNEEIQSVTNISGRIVADGRTSVENGIEVAADTSSVPDLNKNSNNLTMVYRSYATPDVTEGNAVDLKVDYVNTLKVGSVTVKKVLEYPGEAACGMTWAEFKNAFVDKESVTFRFTFTNIAGRYLESYLNEEVMADLEVAFTEFDNVNHTISGSATLEGIPAGTEYRVDEVQVNGIVLIKISNVEVESGTDIVSHELLGEVDENNAHTGIGNDGTADYGQAVAYNSNVAFTFSNTFEKTIDISVEKQWDSTVPVEEHKEVSVTLQRKAGDGAWTNVATRNTEDYKAVFENMPTVDENKELYKYRVIEEDTDGRYIVFYNTNTDGSITLINASVNRTYYVQDGVERELPILPESVDDKASVAQNYDISVTTIDGKNDVTNSLFSVNSIDGTIKYTAPDVGVETYRVNFTPKTSESSQKEQSITIAVYAYDTNNDIYVLDYGLSAKLADKNYPGQSFNGKTGEAVLKNGLFANDVYNAVINDSVTNEIAGISSAADGTFGLSVEQEGWNGKLTLTQSEDNKSTAGTDAVFTPTKFMDQIDEYYYKTIIRSADASNVAEENITAENGVVMTAKAKVMPANVVYYEDNFNNSADSEESLTDTKKGIVYGGYYGLEITIPGDEGEDPLDVMQSIDQDEAYGYDDAYQDAQGTNAGMTDSLGSAVGLWGDEDFANLGTAKFTFTGTGFDIVGRTEQDSAKLTYIVKATQDVVINGKTYAAGKIVKMGTVDTAYKTDNSDSLYQIPVVSIKDLPRSTYDVSMSVLKRANEYGEYNIFYLDGIRIYNSLEDTSDYNEAEKDTVTTEIRQMILGDTKLTDQGTVESPSDIQNAIAAIVNYLGSGASDIYDLGVSLTEVPGYEASETSDINDYLVSGPKHELYLPSGSAVAFMVTPDTTVENVTLQVEAKAVNTTPDQIDYPTLLNVADINDYTAAIKINSSTAMYYKLDLRECKKSEDGKSYLVILANSADSASDISLTNLKTKGCTLSYPDTGMIHQTAPVVVPPEEKEPLQEAFDTYKENLTDVKEADPDEISITDVRLAANYVRQDGIGYINITLKNANGSYRPQLYRYTESGIEPLEIASASELTDGVVDPDTLYPVRDYKDANDDTYYVYKVRVKFPAEQYTVDAETKEGIHYLAVAAVNYSSDGGVDSFTEITPGVVPLAVQVKEAFATVQEAVSYALVNISEKINSIYEPENGDVTDKIALVKSGMAAIQNTISNKPEASSEEIVSSEKDITAEKDTTVPQEGEVSEKLGKEESPVPEETVQNDKDDSGNQILVYISAFFRKLVDFVRGILV